MATYDDVRRLALSLPETTETTAWGNVTYKVRDKTFVWERPLNQADLRRLGDTPPPEGPLLGIRVADLDAKEEVLAEDAGTCFTIEHFHGFPAVLCRLDAIEPDRLEELVVEAWLCRAPARLAKAYLAGQDG